MSNLCVKKINNQIIAPVKNVDRPHCATLPEFVFRIVSYECSKNALFLFRCESDPNLSKQWFCVQCALLNKSVGWRCLICETISPHARVYRHQPTPPESSDSMTPIERAISHSGNIPNNLSVRVSSESHKFLSQVQREVVTSTASPCPGATLSQ